MISTYMQHIHNSPCWKRFSRFHTSLCVHLSILISLFSLPSSFFPLFAQQRIHHEQVMFWNVENLFWPEDDPTHDDDEFTPDGIRHWTQGRMRQKMLQLSRVLLAAGKGRAPMLVGLAEVEGDSVMRYWTHSTPLWEHHYDYVITDGPDARGIQTALLYQGLDFKLLDWQGYTVEMPQGVRPTRQILHAAGRVVSGDTLDVLVCHLPSRLGGAMASQPAREAAHSAVMHLADSLSRSRQIPHIIIMGDMNDFPNKHHAWWGDDYENLMLPLQKALRWHPSRYGSHKYQGEWGYLDQFILNRGWESGNLHIGKVCSFFMPFQLTTDDSHLGHRPFRSYYGYQFEGGYSDHLPILLDLDIYFE